jgi:hypothetical protein
MDKNNLTRGANGDTPIKELKWMAEFLATHGQPKKALEIYRALVDTLLKRQDGKVQPLADESSNRVA